MSLFTHSAQDDSFVERSVASRSEPVGSASSGLQGATPREAPLLQRSWRWFRERIILRWWWWQWEKKELSDPYKVGPQFP
jgi:hypothetical protein